MGKLNLYFSVAGVVTLLFLPFAGKIMAKYDIRLILIVAIILQAGAFAIFGLMKSVWGWYIFAVPLTVGGVFITVIAGPVIINQWFKKSNGLALGIMTATVGLIGIAAQPIIAKLISAQGWRSSYIIVGLFVIAIVVPTILLFIKKSPQSKGIQPYGADMVDQTQQTNAAPTSAGVEEGISMAVAKKSSAFYALIIFFFLITSIASFSMQIPTYLSEKGFDVTFAGNVMGTYMGGVLVGSLLIGFLSDKIGSKMTALLAMVLGIISFGLLLFASSSTLIISIAMALFGVIASSIGTLGPALTTSLFGNKEYSQIYSSASLGLAISSVVALPIYGFAYDLTGSYTIVLYAIVIMLFINIICVAWAFKGKDKLVKAGHWNSEE